MPKLTSQDPAAEYQLTDKDIVAAVAQAVKGFMGWSEPPLALVCDDLALSLSKKGLLRQVSKHPTLDDVNEPIKKFHIPEQDIRMDIFSNNAEQTVRLIHIPTGESAVYTQRGFFNVAPLSYLKEMAIYSLYRKEAVINYYENEKKGSSDG